MRANGAPPRRPLARRCAAPGGHPACAQQAGAARAHIRHLADNNPHTGVSDRARSDRIILPRVAGLSIMLSIPLRLLLIVINLKERTPTHLPTCSSCHKTADNWRCVSSGDLTIGSFFTSGSLLTQFLTHDSSPNAAQSLWGSSPIVQELFAYIAKLQCDEIKFYSTQ